MSGEKRIMVDEAEYRKLRANEKQLRVIRQDLPQLLDALNQKNTAELQRQLSPLAQRQQEFQKAISNVRSDIKKMEVETAKKLENQHKQMQTALQSAKQSLRADLHNSENRIRNETRQVVDQLRVETQNAIAEQSQLFGNMLQQERTARQQEMQEVRQQLTAVTSALQNEQRRKQEIAQSWLEATVVIYNFITTNYRHELFAPRQLDKFKQQLELIKNNIQEGNYEVALGHAQTSYTGLSDLRLELEQKESEWHVWHCTALDSSRHLLGIARANRQVDALNSNLQPILDKNNNPYLVEVDYWTQGKLSELDRELVAQIARLETANHQLTTEELRTLVEKTVPDYKERLGELIQEARISIVSSQSRQNIAEMIVEELEAKGFVLDDSTYEGSDMRYGYAAKVKHHDSSEIVVVVTPVPGEPGRNELKIETFDDGRASEEELKERADELAQALQERGLQTDSPRTTRDAAKADLSLRDLEQIRQRQPNRQQI